MYSLSDLKRQTGKNVANTTFDWGLNVAINIYNIYNIGTGTPAQIKSVKYVHN